MIDDLMKAIMEEDEDYIKEEPLYRGRIHKKSRTTSFKGNAALREVKTVTIACGPYSKGKKNISERNRLIFLSALLRKRVKVKNDNGTIKIQIEGVSSEEEAFIKRFVENNYTITV